MQICQDNLVGRIGSILAPLPGASVSVTDDATNLPASLYRDNGVTPLAQPLLTNEEGYYEFYAANGEYTLTFTGGRVKDTITRKVVLADPSDNPYASKAELAAGSGAALVTFTQAGAGAVPQPMQDKARQRLDVMDFIPQDFDFASDASAHVQAAINQLATFGRGTLGCSIPSLKIAATIDFSVLGGEHRFYTVDFGGAEFTWIGSNSAVPMFRGYNNKSVTVKNFTLFGSSDSTISAVTGLKVDSLQPDGADLMAFSSFRVRFCTRGIDFGSVGADQNRVSDCRIKHALLESCAVGLRLSSTNVDSLIFEHTQVSACATGIELARAGFLKIDTAIGYACQKFIAVTGPIGPLTIINSQSEPGGVANPCFLYRNRYDDARTGPITLVSCNVDDKIFLDYEALVGSDAQVLNIVGGYFREMEIACPDTVVNLIGTHQTVGYTITLSGANTKLYNFGSRISGTVVDSVAAQRVPLYGDTSANYAIGTAPGQYAAAGRSVLFTDGVTGALLGLGYNGARAGYFASGAGVVEVAADAGFTLNLTAAGAIHASFAASGMTLKPKASVTPAANGDMLFELTSNTQLKVKVKGSDGVVRSTSLTLA